MRGRLAEVDWSNLVTHYLYDDDGNRTAEVLEPGPEPNDANHTRMSTYDLRGRLVEVAGPTGGVEHRGGGRGLAL